MLLKDLDINMHEILCKCQETIKSFCKIKKMKKMKNGVQFFKSTSLSVSECCSFQQSCTDECSNLPCLMFFLQGTSGSYLDKLSGVLANMIYPVLLKTIIKGDPRICSANIIWISPDTTTWIRNPSKSQKGELALDVVLEKSVVKQSGDAWRTVLDCCLPVFHLIDTRRSVPYAIKQVQELLGVSCAFEQAVQRLSASVTMVAKGIRKEHLILLANSMTCAGNLVGFNSGGYKALSRSLNVQVPFTEATLFTPRKCFEKASEKCHTDNLSSVVAACSWGKHVAVGTGSRFDVLWDTKNVGLSQEDGIDVYNFLHTVRSSAGVEQSDTGCLGEEVDELEDDMDWSLSPEHNFSSGKPVFEDCVEDHNWLENKQENENWENVSISNNDSCRESDAWCNWDSEAAWGKGSDNKLEEVRTRVAKPSTGWGTETAWGKGSDDKLEKVGMPAAKPLSGWGSEGHSTKSPEDCGKSSDWEGKDDAKAAASWRRKGIEEKSGWDTTASWQIKAQDKLDDVGSAAVKLSSVWGSQEVNSSKVWEDLPKSSAFDDMDEQLTQVVQHEDLPVINHSWGQPNTPEIEMKQPSSGGWDVSDARGNDDSSWGQQKPSENESRPAASSSGWDLPNATGGNESEKHLWGQLRREPFKKNRFEGSQGWPSNSGEWKGKKSRPPRSPGMVYNNSILSGMYTVTRQRLDMFTSEEQDILSDIEPIMRSIRKIMHQSGYNDGDPLSADDHSFVSDNVFNYHPDKAVKMGAGIDYFMVDKHSSFQDSRCFYVVSSDGSKQDFSYRKCLENFIRGKYPGLVDEFIGKYFRKPRSGGNRESSLPPVPEENRDQD